MSEWWPQWRASLWRLVPVDVMCCEDSTDLLVTVVVITTMTACNAHQIHRLVAYRLTHSYRSINQQTSQPAQQPHTQYTACSCGHATHITWNETLTPTPAAEH